VPHVLSSDDLAGIRSMKLILRYDSSKPPLYKLFQIGNVDYAKDSLDVFCDTVLTPILQG
jgi:hypothetical protein